MNGSRGLSALGMGILRFLGGLGFFPVSARQRKPLQPGSSLPGWSQFSPGPRKKRDLRGSSGLWRRGDNAVILNSNSEQLKSHFIHQVPNETPCSKWNGEIQLEQPDCLRYLLLLLPVPRLRAAEPAGWHVVWPYTFENSRCWGKWFYCRSDLLPSPTKPLILKKGPVPQ